MLLGALEEKFGEELVVFLDRAEGVIEGFTGALLLFGLGQGLAEPITDTALNERAPDEFRGSIMSIRTSVLRLGTTIGPPLSVGAAAVFGYRRTLLISGSGAFIIGATWFIIRRS